MAKSRGRQTRPQPQSMRQAQQQTSQPPPALALSVRQPWAELIMSGEKLSEFRSQPTRIRGRIFIYASLGRYPRADEAEWAAEYGLDDVDGLPRGVLVGTVELWACEEVGDGTFEWLLMAPERLAGVVKPERRANPVWFRPFG